MRLLISAATHLPPFNEGPPKRKSDPFLPVYQLILTYQYVIIQHVIHRTSTTSDVPSQCRMTTCWPHNVGTKAAVAKQFSASFSDERDTSNELMRDLGGVLIILLHAGL